MQNQTQKQKYTVAENGRIVSELYLVDSDAEMMIKNGLNLVKEMKIQEQKYVNVPQNLTGDFSENGCVGRQMTEADAIRMYGEKEISKLEKFIQRTSEEISKYINEKYGFEDEDETDERRVARSETYGLGNYAGDVVG